MTNTAKKQTKIVVAGAGVIGQAHIRHVIREATLAAIVDPDPQARSLAAEYAVPWYPDLTELLVVQRPDGVIVATPTALHVEHTIQCIEAGIAVLVEKPIAHDLMAAQLMVKRAKQAGVPLMVGHHRRHNPLVAKARQVIESGRLGRIVAVNVMCWFFKPDEYFDIAWRRQPGAGPILTNMIHDIDLLRHLCGEVASVVAHTSDKTRSHAVEDSAVVLLKFANGALGTVTVSDSIVAPWNWELTAGENPAYPTTGMTCLQIGGSMGSLSVPDNSVWYNPDRPHWMHPISREVQTVPSHDDPLARQIRHFREVIDGAAQPLVSGAEGLATLKVVQAVRESAQSGERISIS